MPTSRRILVLVVVVLIVSSLSPSLAVHWIVDKPSNVLRGLIRPLVSVLTQLNGTLRGTSEQSQDQFDKDRLYHEVLVEIARLRQELAEAYSQIAQLNQGIRVLGTERPYLLPARVIDAAIGRGHRSLIINCGRRDGIHDGQVVVDGANLVGFVARTATITANVRLITAMGRPLQVNIAPAGPGVPPRNLNAMIRLDDTGQHFTLRVGKHKDMAVGEVARLIDPAYPREAHFFIVGIVTEIRDDPTDPLMYDIVIIKPSVELHHLRQVIVLVAEGARVPILAR